MSQIYKRKKMLDIQNSELAGIKAIKIIGRIDGISSPILEKSIKDLATGGERKLLINMEGINYISSAGLRVFLSAQQTMSKAGGELILYKLSEQIFYIFKTAGFHKIFKIINDFDEISDFSSNSKKEHSIKSETIDNIKFKILESPVGIGKKQKFGNMEKLTHSEFSEADLISLSPDDLSYGIGLAALGEDYKDFKKYFGETAILNRNFFVYPAVKKPAVDYMLPLGDSSQIKYNFFTYNGFQGNFKYIISFEGVDGFVNSDNLFQAILKLTEGKLFGLVFFAESKGLWGMNLKQVPIIENQTKAGGSIFSENNFSNWFDFPVEDCDFNCILVGTGFVHNFSETPPSLKDYFAAKSNWHIHSVVFEKGIINRNIENFDEELKRITSELEPLKVVHLLEKTTLSTGCIGLVELED